MFISITAVGVVPCGGPKKSPRISSIVHSTSLCIDFPEESCKNSLWLHVAKSKGSLTRLL